MNDGDSLLVGFDLVKDVGRLEAAYNDSRGVTAAFNRNVLSVLNRELGATFDAQGFEHVAFFDRDNEWVEMRLRSARPQRTLIRELGMHVAFAEGEDLRTEISAKFRTERIGDELGRAGLGIVRSWTDAAGDFCLVLAVHSPT
jgi:L-histidine N-alpha-methyltransferase